MIIRRAQDYLVIARREYRAVAISLGLLIPETLALLASMKSRLGIRGLAVASLFSVLISAGFAQVAAEPTLRLPDLKVTDSADLPPPESWRYAQVAGFDVISNASDRSTRKLLADFATFTQAMRLVWPAPAKPLASTTLVLCGKGGKFDEFTPAGATRDEAIVPSLFLRNREQAAIVVDVETDTVTVDATKTVIDTGGVVDYAIDHYSQLYREYIHYLLSQSQVRPPVWLEEGLAQIIMDIEVTDEALYYGKINTNKGAASGGESPLSDGTDPTVSADSVVGEQPFNVVLQHRKLMPFPDFFAITADSPEARNPLGNNLWAKQAYAFVHFCMFGEDLRYKEALGTFVQRLAREPVSEPLFKECFKVSYADMQKQLRGYILRVKHKYQKYPLQKSDQFTAKSIELRDATPAEVGLIKGDAQRLAGRLDTAFTTYRIAYLRGAREAPLLAGLGLTESALNHTDRARELLENAAKAGTNRPSAYAELARLRLAAATSAPAGNGGKLSGEQMASVLGPLFEARKRTPPIPETYELIAAAWSRSAVAPTTENLAVLDEGIRAFPRNSPLLLSAAQLYHQAGAAPTAASIAKLGIRFSADPATRTQFEQLLASLPAAGK